MGINPTQSNFKSFTFDGVNSRQYGVYITGAGVFNAPERNVEMLDIAGRNGAFVLDKGSFLNIEVTYPASIACDNETDFAEAVSDLRNLLCSKVGYVRLEDDYNPNEYRLAIYKSGLEVSHDFLIAGEFDLVFECKPQRYLKSGETAISVTSGNTITNPTRFEAKPLLEIDGYGEFSINGDVLSVNNGAIGWIPVAEAKTANASTVSTTFNTQYANASDSLKFGNLLNGFEGQICVWWQDDVHYIEVSSITGDGVVSFVPTWVDGWQAVVCSGSLDRTNTYSYGTPSSHSVTGNILLTLGDNTTKTIVFTITIDYDGSDTFTTTVTQTLPVGYNLSSVACSVSQILLDSTKSAAGNPLYFDLDIGEAYKIEGGVPVSVNSAVSIPSELPTLASGANTITYDNTFTQFKVVPRWWKV